MMILDPNTHTVSKTRMKPATPHYSREENLKLLFDLINQNTVCSRRSLARMTSLSASTVSSLVDNLLHAHLIKESGLERGANGSGRRATMLNINPEGLQIPVFSFSRQGVNFTLFDLCFNVLEQSFQPHLSDVYSDASQSEFADHTHDVGADYAAIIEDLFNRHLPSMREDRIAALLISYPGVYLENENRFAMSSMQVSMYKAAFDALEERIGLPLYMGNSSMNLAYAEKKHLDAHGQSVRDLIFINVCDGVGAGIVSNDLLMTSPDRLTGEIGHMTVEIGGRPCFCGNRGCLERYINVSAIKESVAQAMRRDMPDGEHIPLQEIGEAYAKGVPAVREALRGIAEKLFAGIYSIVSVLGIKRIIIGGLEDLGVGFLDLLRSFCTDGPTKILLHGIEINYPQTPPSADSIGIAQYYIDKAFTIRCANALTNEKRR